MTSLDYYLVRRVDNEPRNQNVHKTYQVTKWSGHRQPDEVGTVRQFVNGTYDSDDYGFAKHHNELASKRIQVVKHHVSLGEPVLTSYWKNDDGGISHHTTKIHPLFK